MKKLINLWPSIKHKNKINIKIILHYHYKQIKIKLFKNYLKRLKSWNMDGHLAIKFAYNLFFKRFHIFHFLYVYGQFVPISNSSHSKGPASFCVFLKNRTMKIPICKTSGSVMNLKINIIWSCTLYSLKGYRTSPYICLDKKWNTVKFIKHR